MGYALSRRLWYIKSMDKIVPIKTDRFEKEVDKGKALGRFIDEHNRRVKREKERKFREDLNSISRYVEKKVARNPKYFFFGR